MTARAVAVLAAAALVPAACGVDVGVSQGESQPVAVDEIEPPSTIDEGRPGDTEPTTPAPTDAPDTPGSTDEPGTVPLDPDGEYVPEPIVWEEYRGSVEFALLDVPVDYDDPASGSIELFLTRHSATDPDLRVGSLLVNPGGPGFGGSDYAIFASQLYDEELLQHFDIIGWDPRGTGESEPVIDCIDDYDRYFGSVVDLADDPFAAAEELAREFAAECEQRNPDIVLHVGTNNAARDMDSIRRALGEDTISYLGLSYGSELGAVWTTLFPDTVRAAVFDGAADPTADSLEGSLQQMRGFQASLDRFLDQCSNDPSCAFHNGGDAGGAFDRLLADLAAEPVPSDPDRPVVGRSIASTAAIMAMYNDLYWPQLEVALADAAAGNGSGLLALHDSYYQRRPDGTWGNELEAFQTISCADTAERPTREEVLAELPLYQEAAPRLFPDDAAPGYFCSFFPTSVDPRIDVTGAGAGPIVVIGTTGDPTTPLESSRTMAATLEDGRLVIVDSNNHGGYFTSECARRVVAEFLVDLEAPADGTECD